jgi:hypothetical protein
MATSLHQESAKIIPFPPRGSLARGGSRQDAKAIADAASPRAPKIVVGSGWYHEAAIQEAERVVKR